MSTPQLLHLSQRNPQQWSTVHSKQSMDAYHATSRESQAMEENGSFSTFLEGSFVLRPHPFSYFLYLVVIFIMSFIFRDPFFDGFDDLVSATFNPKFMKWALEDESAPKKHSKKTSAKNHDTQIAAVKEGRISPFSGFGRMDMHETDKDYQLSVDIPGMDRKDIKVTAENNALVIEGERKEEKEDKKNGKYHFMERHFGSFRREMSIPSNADAEKIDAVYENGVLKVVIPKKEKEVEKKMITVN